MKVMRIESSEALGAETSILDERTCSMFLIIPNDENEVRKILKFLGEVLP